MAPYLLPHHAKRLCQTLCIALTIGLATAPVFAQVDFTQGNTPMNAGPFRYGEPGQREVTPGQPPASPEAPASEPANTSTTSQPVSPSLETPGAVTLDMNRQLPVDDKEVPLLLEGVLRKTQDYPIDLQTVLALVDDKNLYIAESRMTRKMQRNRFYRSLANFLPDLEGSYSHSRFQGGIQVFGNEVITIYQTRITPQMTASTTVYPGGRRIFEALAAKRRSSSAKQLLKGTRQEQLTQAADEYYQLLEARIQVENLTNTVKEAATQVEFNNARLEAGVGTKLDLMQSKTFLAQQGQELIEAENILARAEQTLLERLNLDPTIHLMPDVNDVNDLETITLVSNALDSETLTRWAERNHPEIRELDFEAKALKADFIARATDIIPAVDLQAYESWPGSNFDNLTLTRFGGLVARTQIGANAGLGWPLDLRHDFLEYKQKLFERDAMIRNVQQRITSALLNTRSYQQAIQAARVELESSTEASRLARGRYQVGLGVYLDVLTAASSISRARITLAGAILRYNRAQIELLEALGAATPETLMTGFDPDTFNPKKDDDDDYGAKKP